MSSAADLWSRFKTESNSVYNFYYNDNTRASELLSKAYMLVVKDYLNQEPASKLEDTMLGHLLVVNASPTILAGNLINLDTISFNQVKNNGLKAQFGASGRYNMCTEATFRYGTSINEPNTRYPAYDIRVGDGSTISRYMVILPTDTVCTAVKMTYYKNAETLDVTNTDDLLWGSPELEDAVVKKMIEQATLPARDQATLQQNSIITQINQ